MAKQCRTNPATLAALWNAAAAAAAAQQQARLQQLQQQPVQPVPIIHEGLLTTAPALQLQQHLQQHHHNALQRQVRGTEVIASVRRSWAYSSNTPSRILVALCIDRRISCGPDDIIKYGKKFSDHTVVDVSALRDAVVHQRRRHPSLPARGASLLRAGAHPGTSVGD